MHDRAPEDDRLGPAEQPWAVWLSASRQVLERPSRDAALVTAAARNNAYGQECVHVGVARYALVLHYGSVWSGEEAGPGARVSPDTRKVHVQLADLLREQIREGQPGLGNPLPRQLELAQSYGVALKTVKEAQRLLIQEGLLGRSGRGVVVTSKPAPPAQALPGLDLKPIQPTAEPAARETSHHGTAAYRHLAQRLEELIRNHAYPAGSVFPTARAIAQHHAYTVGSAQQAIRSLKDRRLLLDGPRGTTVVPAAPPPHRQMPGRGHHCRNLTPDRRMKDRKAP
ncbi:GntR family transcriptional regulator [Streptomyces sp. MS2.AVA.5]|uniref:GntR family transcriptional regulator n=1 Tax=Streptomyces achmelvichensis TaxID=3134111 RepID=A0ACC6Q905_9ACTN